MAGTKCIRVENPNEKLNLFLCVEQHNSCLWIQTERTCRGECCSSSPHSTRIGCALFPSEMLTATILCSLVLPCYLTQLFFSSFFGSGSRRAVKRCEGRWPDTYQIRLRKGHRQISFWWDSDVRAVEEKKHMDLITCNHREPRLRLYVPFPGNGGRAMPLYKLLFW